MWIMDKGPDKSSTFHYAEPITLKDDAVFYDRTCDDKGCLSTIATNYASVYEGFQKNSSKHLFIVRDFTYARALKEKNFKKAQEILRDIEKALAIAQESLKGQGNLILLSTAGTMLIDFPEASMDNPTQCIALAINNNYLKNTIHYLNEFYNSDKEEMHDWKLLFHK